MLLHFYPYFSCLFLLCTHARATRRNREPTWPPEQSRTEENRARRRCRLDLDAAVCCGLEHEPFGPRRADAAAGSDEVSRAGDEDVVVAGDPGADLPPDAAVDADLHGDEPRGDVPGERVGEEGREGHGGAGEDRGPDVDVAVALVDRRERLQRNMLRQAAEKEWNERNYDNNLEENPDIPDLIVKSFTKGCSISTTSPEESDVTANTLELRQNLKDTLRSKQDHIKTGACGHDRIRLGSAGWKSRFCRENFGVQSLIEVGKQKNDMVQKYIEGLCWMVQYYFSDVPSWSWYYPFHYAPFASDLKGLSQLKMSFTKDKPLKPFDQLMAVLPPESSSALPKCYRELMNSEESSIQMFYPSDLQIDTHGKRFLWQGIVKLPFIDEKLLLSATKTVEKDLLMHEMSRNSFGQDKIFVGRSNTLANNAASFAPTSNFSSGKILIDSATSELGGWLSPADDDDDTSGGFFHSPIKDMQDIINDHTMSFTFFNPEPVKPIPRLLDHVKIPEKSLTEDDIPRRPLWHTYPGTRPPPATTITAAAVEARPGVSSSSFGRGRGSATSASAAPQRWSSGRGRGFHGSGDQSGTAAQIRGGRVDGGGGACNFRPAGRGQHGGGAFHWQNAAWLPVAPGSRGGGGGGHAGNGQARGW